MHEDSQVGHQRGCYCLHHQGMKGLEWALRSACSAEELSTVRSSILLWATFDVAGKRELVQQWEQVSREWGQLERIKLEQSGALKVMGDSQDSQEEVQMTQIHLPHELAAVRDKSSPEGHPRYLGVAQEEGRARQVSQDEGMAIEAKNASCS